MDSSSLVILCVAVLFTTLTSAASAAATIDNSTYDVAQSKDSGYRHWRWGHPKVNRPDNLYLQDVIKDIPADERWMRSIDIPSLHMILDAYSKAVKKTGWLSRFGRTFQNRVLQRILKTQIKRFAISNRDGPADNEVEPRFLNPFGLMPCVSSFTEPGLCLSSSVCALVGGTEGGECFFGKSCCVINRVLTGCTADVVSNNTYWQSSPLGVDTGSLCVMSIPLNTGVIQQRYQPVCQVRLDFEIFSIAQPSATTSDCDTDYFRVSGAINSAPPICGDNARQHMYLNSKPTANVIQLVVGIGRATNVDRSWRIKIALLPCFADYLAPPDCLQYHSQSTGMIKSFNWRDAAPVAASPRQLADQDYQICFRQEALGNNQSPRLICLSECAVTTTGARAFSLSGDSTAVSPLSGAGATGVTAANSCPFDFLLFAGGFDVNGNRNDRFCGNRLHPNPGQGTSVAICSNFKPFRIRYVTNRAETDAASNPAQADVANNGFCLSFVQIL